MRVAMHTALDACNITLLFKAFLLLLASTSPTAASRPLALSFDRQLIGQHQEQNATFHVLSSASCKEVHAINPKARESQSCSLGATRPFVGPLQTWLDVKAMLQARSYKGELILTHETHVDAATQWIWRLLRMGYAHTVVVMRGEHSCAQLRKLYSEQLGCVWFPRSISYSAARAAGRGGPPLLEPGQVALFLEEPAFWRLQLAAMVLRLGGYNLLTLDTDVIVQDDFYWWMQQPEYRDYTLLAQRDATGLPNLRVMYARSASPSGPTAWALAESVLRNVRWLEQPQLPTNLNCTFATCWEQAVVTDSIYSALVGRPIFRRCLEARPLDRSWNVREDGRERFLEAHRRLIEPSLTRKNYSMSRPGPACHADLAAPAGLWGLEGRLLVPRADGQWPEELGGRALGERGAAAAAFRRMLQEAGTPLWPDPEDASEDPDTAAAAVAAPPERFALLSRHLACDWSSCGSAGMFLLRPPTQGQRGQAEQEQEPCVVLGHLGLTPDKALGKRLQLMANGQYNMDLAAAVHGPGGPYFATNAQHQGLGHHAAMMRAGMGGHHARRGQPIPAPKVIALVPGTISPGPNPAGAVAGASDHPLVLVSKDHLVSVMEALSSLAVATGRTLALPRLSCDYPWMHRESGSGFNGSHHVPWTYLEGQAFAPYGPSLDHLSCEWLAWAQHGCLHGPVHVERPGHVHVNPHPTARMLLSYEMEYLIRQLTPEERTPRAPAGDVGGGGNLLTVPPGTAAGPDGVVNVTLAQVSEQLSRIAPEHTVVWAERPMRVVDLSVPLRAAQQQWINHCCGLSWPRSRNHICFWDF